MYVCKYFGSNLIGKCSGQRGNGLADDKIGTAAGHSLYFFDNTAMHGFQKKRHGNENGGLIFAEIGKQMRKACHIGNTCAGIQYTQKSCHAFIGMMKRKNRESSVLRRDFNLFKNSDDVRTDIILTEHNAFGNTRRTGGINENTEGIWVDNVLFIGHITADAKG